MTRNLLAATVLRFASRLRFPNLFMVTAAIFLIDLLLPDFIPFADELLLGLLTVLLGSIKKSGTANEPARPTA